MKLKFFISACLLLASGSAFSAQFCSTEQPVYHVDLGNININPGAQVGDIIGQSELISKKITCSRNGLAVLKAQNNKLTDIYITVPGKPTIQGGTCRVMESGFPGLGIAWYNYNSGTGRWHCFSNNEQQGRGMSNSTRDIMDIIYLVKIGDISTGTFDFNRNFEIYEANGNATAFYGKLYEIILSGNTIINAPTCDLAIKQKTKSYTFPINDALTQSFLTEDMIIDVICTGYIENGTVLNYKVVSTDGVYSQNNDYFGTSIPGLGVSIKYKDNINDSNEHNLFPSNVIDVAVDNNKASFSLMFSPYVKNGTGIYPLISDSDFNISINPINVDHE